MLYAKKAIRSSLEFSIFNIAVQNIASGLYIHTFQWITKITRTVRAVTSLKNVIVVVVAAAATAAAVLEVVVVVVCLYVQKRDCTISIQPRF